MMEEMIMRWSCSVVMEFCGKSGILWMARSLTETLDDAWIFRTVQTDVAPGQMFGLTIVTTIFLTKSGSSYQDHRKYP